jgi:hypothetical protein
MTSDGCSMIYQKRIEVQYALKVAADVAFMDSLKPAVGNRVQCVYELRKEVIVLLGGFICSFYAKLDRLVV